MKAALVLKHGLDQELAKTHQCGSTRPGSFHVFAAPAGLQLAYEFAQRHEPPHLILRGELPLGVFTDLIKLGAVVEERIIGSDASDPPQVVFFPPAYLVFNKSVRWLDPFIPPRKK
jgi:hypothetical protein